VNVWRLTPIAAVLRLHVAVRGFNPSTALQFLSRRWRSVLAFEDDLSDGVFVGMRDGEVGRVCAGTLEEFARETVKEDEGRARRV
jgi:hypothetical protein